MEPKIVPEFNDAWNQKLRDHLQNAAAADALLMRTLKALPIATHFRDLFTIAVVLQCLSYFRSARVLIEKGKEQEVWVLIRCLSEQIIRLKWCYKRKKNADWLVIGHEVAQKNRFIGDRSRSSLAKEAIQAIEQRLTTLRLDKRGRCWDKKKNKTKKLPTAEDMAKECGLTRLYRSYFRMGSQATHGAHPELERFLALDEKGEWRGFIVDPIPASLIETASRLNMLFVFLIALLNKNGWKVEQSELDTIFNCHNALNVDPKRKGNVRAA